MTNLSKWVTRAAASLLLTVAFTAHAQYPTKPIQLIVPFPAGGTPDNMGRTIASQLSERLGQQVVVVNKPGANGNIGSEFVAQAPADGYTLLLSGVGSHGINQTLYKNLRFNVLTGYTHIALVAAGANVLVANPTFEASSFADLLRLAKERPGKLIYASTGNGSSNHLSMEMVKAAAGIEMTHAPYGNGPKALVDIMGGQVPMMFINLDTALPHVKAGKLRALAVTSPARAAVLPDVPTVAEHGFPGFSAQSWTGISGPAGMPKEIVERLNKEIVAALNDPAVKEKFGRLGLTPMPMSPREATAWVAAEIDKWGTVVRAANAKID